VKRIREHKKIWKARRRERNEERKKRRRYRKTLTEREEY
jgi:hypothetical protein